MTRRAISGGPYPAAADFKALCADPEVNKQVLKDMQAVGAAANLKGFEQACPGRICFLFCHSSLCFIPQNQSIMPNDAQGRLCSQRRAG